MPAIGDTLKSRYRVLEKLGEGGQSKVYIAADMEDSSKGRLIIKEMIASASEDENTERLTLFSREYELLKDLSHPLLIKVYDFFQEKDNYYLVEEYVTGLTLESIIRKKPVFEEERALEVIIDLADALSYLHKNNIIYRDIKPSNIIIHQDGNRARLIDFNIARTFKIGQEKDTVRIGTHGYSPPEQYGRGQTDCRSDIYSLGVLLHQLVTGIDPVAEPFRCQFTHPYPSTKEIIEKAASMRCADRYQSMEELKTALSKKLSRKKSLPPSIRAKTLPVPVIKPAVIPAPSPVNVPLSSSVSSLPMPSSSLPSYLKYSSSALIFVAVVIFSLMLCVACGGSRFLQTNLDTVKYSNDVKAKEELFRAINLDAVDNVRKILKDRPHLARAVDDRSKTTPLHEAAKMKAFDSYKRTKVDLKIAELLIENGADVNAVDRDGHTPLYYAYNSKHETLVNLLLAKGAHLSVANSHPQPKLSPQSVFIPNPEAEPQFDKNMSAHVKEQLEKNPSLVNQRDANGRTLLHWAVEKRSKETVQLLLDRGAEVDTRDMSLGCTALHLAVKGGQKEIVQLLLGRGADVNAKDKESKTSLHLAVEKGRKEIVQLLLDRGASVSLRTKTGKTVLDLAAKNKEISSLLRKYAQKHLKEAKKIHVLAKQGSLEQIKKIVALTPEAVNLKEEKTGSTALHYAVNGGFSGLVKFLLDMGAEINAKDSKGMTPLHIGAVNGNTEAVELLLEKGADYKIQDKDKRTAFYYAVQNSHADIVNLIEQKEVKARVRDSQKPLEAVVNENGLFEAIKKGDAERVKEILELKPELIYANYHNSSPLLHLAISRYQNGLKEKEIIELLLAKGAEIEGKDNRGYTALHCAVEIGYLEAVELLLEKGASVNARANNNYTPLRIASLEMQKNRYRRNTYQDDYQKIQELLDRYGGTY